MTTNSRISSRKKITYQTCKQCGHKFDTSKAMCTSCGFWNTPSGDDGKDQTILLSEVSETPITKIVTGPWDKCFSDSSSGGGIATTSVTLIGGAPGAGKSTLSLQLADKISARMQREILYVGAEESVNEIKNRAMRLKLESMSLMRMHPMGSNAELGDILLNRRPCAIILDSLPGLVSDPEMAVELCKRFKSYAVELDSPVIIIDHITKQDDFAGLMQLQHAVDTTLSLFPTPDYSMCRCEIKCEDGKHFIRELSTIKNRYGPANVMMDLEMSAKGLIVGLGAYIETDDDEDEDEEYEDDDQES